MAEDFECGFCGTDVSDYLRDSYIAICPQCGALKSFGVLGTTEISLEEIAHRPADATIFLYYFSNIFLVDRDRGKWDTLRGLIDQLGIYKMQVLSLKSEIYQLGGPAVASGLRERLAQKIEGFFPELQLIASLVGVDISKIYGEVPSALIKLKGVELLKGLQEELNQYKGWLDGATEQGDRGRYNEIITPLEQMEQMIVAAFEPYME